MLGLEHRPPTDDKVNPHFINMMREIKAHNYVQSEKYRGLLNEDELDNVYAFEISDNVYFTDEENMMYYEYVGRPIMGRCWHYNNGITLRKFLLSNRTYEMIDLLISRNIFKFEHLPGLYKSVHQMDYKYFFDKMIPYFQDRYWNKDSELYARHFQQDNVKYFQYLKGPLIIGQMMILTGPGFMDIGILERLFGSILAIKRTGYVTDKELFELMELMQEVLHDHEPKVIGFELKEPDQLIDTLFTVGVLYRMNTRGTSDWQAMQEINKDQIKFIADAIDIS